VTEERAKRKLTAILSADVKGYSRLMGEDELSTIETLKKYRELIETLIQQYRGRVVDSPGDNMLTEFSSVVDAVDCAVEIQKELKLKNDELPENRRMEFRIGVNLGDVVEDGERIYGDGVNIAARVESLAEGGGICVSGTTYDQIGKKLDLGYEYLGEQAVKNIEKPVRVYRVLMEPEEAGKVIGEERPRPKHWRWAAIATVAVLIIVAGAWAVWHFYFRPPPIEPASLEKLAFPLPEKPSIAVLPFTNMSGDPEQEYIADGITENIITGLSKTPEMFVIARNSTFTYKDKPVKVRQVSEDLGVRYVLEGSVQKEGDRLRINAQLIDAIQGHHLWAEKYDRNLKDLFALQDEITIKVITELQVKLTEGDYARMLGKGTDNIEAYLKCLHAIQLMRRFIKDDNVKSRKMFEEAIDLDPNYPRPYIYLGWTYMLDGMFGWSKSREESLAHAENLAPKALELDDSLGMPHRLLADIYRARRQWDEALAESEQAVSKDANSMTMFGVALNLDKVGRHEESVAWFEKILRLDPYPPAYFLVDSGLAYFMAERYEDALAKFKRVLERTKAGEYNLEFAHRNLAATYSMLGKEEEARYHAAELLRLDPKFSLELFAKWFRSTYKNRADADPYISALRKAGLPEEPPLPLPDKPSIAVLPFVNMSGDPEQEYFSDGITEEIITALSKTPKMFVIARTSSFKYKGKEVDVRTVGRELGVHYVLEGSVRKAGDKVRITAQLIKAKTNKHLWAERYDRDLKDIFALQDEITMKILTAVRVKLTDGEQARLYGKVTKNLDSFMKILEGMPYFYRFDSESNVQARQIFEEASALDPENAQAFTMLGWTYLMEVWFGLSESPGKAMERVVEMAQKALALNDTIDSTHSLLAHVYLMKRQFEMAITEAEADAQAHLGMILNYAGRRVGAIASLEKAIRLNPIPPNWYEFFLGEAYCLAGQLEKALATYEQVLHRYPEDMRALIGLAATYSLLGREEEARAQATQILRMEPKFNLKSFVKTLPFKNKIDAALLLDSLYKAGLK